MNFNCFGQVDFPIHLPGRLIEIFQLPQACCNNMLTHSINCNANSPIAHGVGTSYS